MEGLFETRGSFRDLKFSLGLGLSRSVFASGAFYTPFVSAGGYESVWNESNLWGLSLPFRYSLNLDTRLSLGSFTAAIALPLVSDAFFDKDFKNRSEDMNWLKLMTGETTGTTPGRRAPSSSAYPFPEPFRLLDSHPGYPP